MITISVFNPVMNSVFKPSLNSGKVNTEKVFKCKNKTIKTFPSEEKLKEVIFTPGIYRK